MDEKDVDGQYGTWLSGRSPVALYVRWYLRHRKPREAGELWEQIGTGVFPKVLDAGCAGGFYLLDAYERGQGTSMLAGVDLSDTLLAEARSRLESVSAHISVRLMRASATKLPFGEASFDVVLSNGMVKYLDDGALERFVSEAGRVLVSGGRLCVAEFGRPVGWGKHVSLARLGIPMEHLRTAEELACVLAGAGFVDVRGFDIARIRRIPLTFEGSVGTRP